MSDFLNLEKEWDALAAHCEYHFPFLCFDWFRIWLKHFMGEGRLLILLVEKEGELKMIAPFLIKREKFKGLLQINKVELMGNVYSPVRTLIANNLPEGELEPCLRCIFDFFRNEFKGWDVLEMDSMPEEYKLVDSIPKIIEEKKFKNRVHHCYADWYLDGISGTGEDYLKNRSKNLKNSLRKRKAKLENIGSLEFRFEKGKGQIDEYLNLFYKVRTKSWKASEADMLFQRENRELSFEKDWLRFGFLFLNGNPIAAQIRLVCNQIAFLMETVHDFEYDQFSPGSILRAEFAKYLIDVDKVKVFDSVKGDESYKREWTPLRRERKGFIIFSHTYKAKIFTFLMTHALPMIEKSPTILKVKKKIVTLLTGKRKPSVLPTPDA